MKNKIKLFLKKLSFVTTHPDSDWMKIFTLLFAIAILSLGWNIYFFFSVKHALTSAVGAGNAKAALVGNVEEERMKSVIQQYDARAAVHDAIIKDAPSEVADPAGA